jgi:cyclohexanone monooxygenase
MPANETSQDFDAVVIGAGFSGLYMLHRLRDKLGMSVRVYETGDGVGGTWYWNRYPGARCDSVSYMYCYSFDKDLLQEWEWTGKFPMQAEILEYLNHVADRFHLLDDIQLETRVTAAHYDEAANRWLVETDRGDRVTARFLITGVGCISAGQVPKFEGLEAFQGEAYHTSRWPHEGVDLTGKRVGVIGTGSSGIQAIPAIAQQAEHLYVFQRTAQFSIPARHHTVDKAFLDDVKSRYDELWEKARWSNGGLPTTPPERSALDFTPEERRAIFEAGWAKGGTDFVPSTFKDIATDKRANDTMAEFIRSKIREIVKDPETAEKLTPVDHPFGSKRTLIDTDYFETYNRPNVTLVDIRHDPIREITATGIRTEDEEYDLDVIVFATGFDAITGSFFKIDIRGRDGLPLKEKWSQGPKTYLGLATAGFPNLLMITGPGSPSVLTNMPVSIEQHVEWISDLIAHMRSEGIDVVEADAEAEESWVAHVNELAEQTFYMLADSWYLGANIPGKPRVFMPYTGGVGNYRRRCDEECANGYPGFQFGNAGRD